MEQLRSASLVGFRPLNPPTLGDFEFGEFYGLGRLRLWVFAP
jgi:hypothetical protein